MDIDHPELVKFSNEKGRICADSLLQAYNTAKQFIEHWNNLSTAMPNLPDEIADGSQSSMGISADGRKSITGEKYHQFKTSCESIITLVESNDNEIKTLLLTIAVNGQARF
jgi:hypothetical protein